MVKHQKRVKKRGQIKTIWDRTQDTYTNHAILYKVYKCNNCNIKERGIMYKQKWVYCNNNKWL